MSHEAERRAEVLARELAQIVEVANDAFVAIDAGGAITEWSRQAERLFGWTRAEVIGRRFAILPPDVQAGDLTGIDEVLRAGGAAATRVELQAQHRDGHLMPVEVTVWAAPPGAQAALNAFVRDLTPGARGGELSCRMGSIVESSEQAIVGAALDGRILSWNPGAEQLYGYPAGVVMGHPLWLLAPPELQAEVHAFVEAGRRGELSVQHETVRRRADGTTVEVSESLAVTRDASGAPAGISLIARDITEERRTAGALAAALDEARELEMRSERFLADAAHQLKTPIAGIRACAQAILGGAGPAERDRLLAAVVEETSRAGRLMAALLQMARIDRGDGLSPAPCDLEQLCRDEAERARRLAPALEVVVDAGLAPAHKPDLDANAVGEILGNLLDNACRHAARRISVGVEGDGDRVTVRVTDDGPGLAPELGEAAFDRFVSGDGGTGLGLPIARGLARAHGGDLTYEDGGFVLRLPGAAQT